MTRRRQYESSCHCFGTNSTQDQGFSNTCDILELYHGGGNESLCHCFGTNSTQDESFSNTCDILELYRGGGNESSCYCFGTNSTQDQGFSNTCDILELSLNRSIKGQEPIAPPNLAKMQLEINKLG
jgi:hypothetical protein